MNLKFDELIDQEEVFQIYYSQGVRTKNSGSQSQGYLDPLYSRIYIENMFWDIIDTPEFQRLRDIKQLGTNFLVFPSALHTRFEHWLGTHHVTKNFLNNLKLNQADTLVIEEKDRNNILAAALWHDLGHGPFSHTFDNNFMQVRFPELNWSHEQWSVNLFEYLIDKNYIDHFDKQDVKLIQDFILGEFRNFDIDDPLYITADRFDIDEKGWMFDIVNNKRNSIDVDKFDYIQRDTYRCGFRNYGFDNTLLMNGARVINNQICYPQSAHFWIHGMFVWRYNLFKDIYWHKGTMSAELQICDIFFESNDYFKFDEICQDMQKYWKLTDKILNLIEQTQDPSLNKAKELIERLKVRDLYSHVASKNFRNYEMEIYSKLTPESISTFWDENIKAKDIRVSINRINYALGEKNPLDYVLFYSGDPYSTFKIAKEKISLIIPHHTMEYSINVFTTDKEKSESVKKGVSKAMKELTGEGLEESYSQVERANDEQKAIKMIGNKVS